MFKRAFGFFAVLSLTGCGACDDGPLQEAPSRIALAVCPRAYQCCTPDQLAENDLAANDVESCKEETKDGFNSRIDDAQEAIDEGRAAYNPARLEACLAYINNATCEELNQTTHFSGVPGCETFVDPLTPPGARCFFHWECLDGLCEITEGSAEGTCRALPKINETCLDDHCAPGLICHGQQNICVALAEPGERCEQSTDCITFICTSSVSTSTANKVCGESPPVAGQCFYSSSCSTFGSAPGDLFTLFVALAALWIARRRR